MLRCGFANDATVSLWFYDAATNASRETLLEIGGTSGIHVLIRNGTIYGCGLKSGTAYATSSSYAAGQWNHVALTLTDGGNAVLYLNGTAVDTQAFTTVTTYGADTGAIGGVSPNGGTSTNENGTSAAAGSQYFAGNIAQVCVHDTALSAAEIKANYLLTGPNAATYLSAVEVSDGAGGELDPSILKYGMILDDSTLKPGLVNDTYASGTGTSDTLKPGVLDSEGNLKPGILDADGNIKPGALRYPSVEPIELTNQTATATGSASADISVDTTGDDGRIYWVMSEYATQPTSLQILLGQDHNGDFGGDSGDILVTATGNQTDSASGLSASTTYYCHMYHDPAFGEPDSDIVTTASFTTDP